jgi:hypothetical protein
MDARYYSNEDGGIQITPKDLPRPDFIRMRPPKHDDLRKGSLPGV